MSSTPSPAPPPTITEVSVDDSEVFVVGLRGVDTAEAWRMLLFKAEPDLDEQDADLGMDSYCVVIDPGQATIYGGIVECKLDSSALHFRLTDEAATVLGVPEEFVFPLHLDEAQTSTLRDGLRRVLTSGRVADRPQLTGF